MAPIRAGIDMEFLVASWKESASGDIPLGNIRATLAMHYVGDAISLIAAYG